MPVTHLKRVVQLIWSGLDAFYICFVVTTNLNRAAIPFWSDLRAALINMQNWGGGLEFLIWLGWGLQLSMILSCILLCLGWKSGVYLSMAQIPLRLIFVIPSVSIMLLMTGFSPWLWLCLCLISEIVKARSLWWLYRT